MYGVVLQDWVSFQGNAASSNSITQLESDWFDASGFQDIVFWAQTGNCDPAGATLKLFFETSPIKNDSTFMAMNAVNLTAGALVQVTPVMMATATTSVVVLARWVRWRLEPSFVAAAWFASFRLLVSLNGPGP
jgi:hypothetical protein